MDANVKLGNNLRYYRKLRDMTLKEMAAKVDLSWGTYQKYETGQIKHVDIDIVKACAKALEVPPSVLLGWEDQIHEVGHNMLTLKEQLEKDPKKTVDAVLFNNNIELVKMKDDLSEAVKLYELYEKADPTVKAAIDTLLKKN